MALKKFSDISKKKKEEDTVDGQTKEVKPGSDKPQTVPDQQKDPKQQDPNQKPQQKKSSVAPKKDEDIGPVNGKNTMLGDKQDTVVINPPKGDPSLKEEALKTAVISWGRMNPPTVGHQKLAQAVISIAKKYNAKPLIYLTHSEDPKKNPLPYSEKIGYAQKAFGDVVVHAPHKTLIEVLKSLQGQFQNIIIVVGADRVPEFTKFVNAYNGREYRFNTIQVISAGDRDPDAEGVEGMSASKMREHARNNNHDEFKKGLPKELHPHSQEIMGKLRKHMKIHEMIENGDDELYIEIGPEEIQGLVETFLAYANVTEKQFKSPEAVIREEISDHINRL